MRRVVVLTQKELVEPDRLKNAITVVIDVFLATSTIIRLLEKGYEPVYPADSPEHAQDMRSSEALEALMLGEKDGEGIEGFEYPDPSILKKLDSPIPAVICSTNGTRAIHSAIQSKELYLSSLLNGHKVAEHLLEDTRTESIVIVCAGNGGHFSAEDFTAAGQIVDKLEKNGEYSFSDASKYARDMFLLEKSRDFEGLRTSQTAELLHHHGYGESIEKVIESFEEVEILPCLKKGKIVINNKE